MVTLLEELVTDFVAPRFAGGPGSTRVTDVSTLEGDLQYEMSVIRVSHVQVSVVVMGL